MKKLFKISILLNLGLAVGLILMWRDGRGRILELAPLAVVEARPPANVAVAAPPAATMAAPKPFHWSELETGDYASYVRNLRSIGCPEWTLRAIVSADVQVVYADRIKDLEKELSNLRNSSWTNQLAAVGTEAAVKAELTQIPDEEVAEINDLLGVKPAPAMAGTPAQVAATEPSLPNQSVPMPLVMQPVDLAQLGLDDSQIQVINELRQDLFRKAGGPNPDPNDPTYLQRLQAAQPEADGMLRGMLGITVFENYQLAASQNDQPPAAGK